MEAQNRQTALKLYIAGFGSCSRTREISECPWILQKRILIRIFPGQKTPTLIDIDCSIIFGTLFALQNTIAHYSAMAPEASWKISYILQGASLLSGTAVKKHPGLWSCTRGRPPQSRFGRQIPAVCLLVVIPKALKG
jgi:hypothetical protein